MAALPDGEGKAAAVSTTKSEIPSSSRMISLHRLRIHSLTGLDRLPTVSASQILQELSSDASKYIRSGLRALDAALASINPLDASSTGGFERGKVTEVWGPVGADATQSLATKRASQVLSRASSTTSKTPSGTDDSLRFRRANVPSLSHLLTMLLHPPADHLSHAPGLIVIDNLNALVDIDYPRYPIATPGKSDRQKWHAGRRYAVLGSLIGALNQVAVLNHTAILVTTGCSSRMRPDTGLGSAVVPGIGGQEWDGGVWNRLVVFRDFAGRFIGVQKSNGKSLISREEIGEIGKVIAFETDSNGLIAERQAATSEKPVIAPQLKLKSSSAPKRSFEEIADSEDDEIDEYGWIDADEHTLAMESLIEEAQIQPQDTAPT